jgi:hypothetical protein
MREGTMSDPMSTGLNLPVAEAADVVEQAQEAGIDVDALEPDLADLAFESDPVDVVEQRLEVGYDDGHDAVTPAS